MIAKKELTKTVRSTRTYRYKIVTRCIDGLFTHAQTVKKTYFNYGLKYLYQHYGAKKLDHQLPSGMAKKYLINKMTKFARRKAKEHGLTLRDEDYNVQSTDKMYEELLVAFDKYRKGQYRLQNYWSDEQKYNYLIKHDCGLSGYMRINYKHNINDVKSVKFKQNKGQLRIVNNYVVHLPYFIKLMVKESLAPLKQKAIREMCVVKRANGDFELQIIVWFQQKKQLTKKQANNIVGLDVNLANNDFFILSDTEVITWPKKIANKYQYFDQRARTLQGLINHHNHGNDDSRLSAKFRRSQNKVKAKMNNIINEWQLNVAKSLAAKHPVLAMEHLTSFTMRLSKRYKKKFRKNTNNKLAKLQPTTFRHQMECVYQNNGGLLLEVNSIDTSKACHECGHINHELPTGMKKWQCPNCGEKLNRDLNATYNIRDWALNPKKHAVMQQRNKYPYLTENDLVKTF